MRGRRAFVVVIDACGVGELPDSADYGDAGANTLLHVAQAVGGLELPTLASLGLGNILELPGVAAVAEPALHGRLHPLGPGKDSTSGHWELMGVSVTAAPPTYADGLPVELVALVEETIGRGVLCARPYDGLAAIEDFGPEHLASGRPILYTSQDSVLQLAAHTAVMGEAELHGACVALRAALASGPHAVQRVIARPFEGEPGAFERTLGRRDLTLAPPTPSYLRLLRDGGVEVHGVGKAASLFPREDFSAVHPGATNEQALAAVEGLLAELQSGLVFANLIETDQRYGHRHDAAGFHDALRLIDASLRRWLAMLEDDDMLVITADHGCDPRAAHTDHTREHAPLLARFSGDGGRRHDGPLADVGASVLDWLTGRATESLPGASFIDA
jgi:phosphopentomutase